MPFSLMNLLEKITKVANIGHWETDMMDSCEGLCLMVVARLKGNVREWR